MARRANKHLPQRQEPRLMIALAIVADIAEEDVQV